MHPAGDVAAFERLAPLYDAVMPSTDAGALQAGLALAERDVERVLDVGGGTGRAARAITAPDRVVVDASGRMLERAQRRGLASVRGAAETLPFRDESVDAVVVVDALHHMADVQSVLAEAHRVVRPGGVLVIREFDRATALGLVVAAAERVVGFDSQFFTPDELAARVSRAGFDTAVPDRGFGYTVAGIRREPDDQTG